METKLKEIQNEIDSLKQNLETVKGRKTEVYTRIVGYYRSVKNWNKGKREEYNYRMHFKHESAEIKNLTENQSHSTHSFIDKPLRNSADRYEFYYKDVCPKCGPVKQFFETHPMQGKAVSVDTDTGMKSALDKSIQSSPTVIFYQNEQEIFRAHSVNELNDFLA